MAAKKELTVASPSSAYQRMAPRWALIEAVLGGTESMRSAGKAYLPQHERETDAAYRIRRERTVLKNLLEQTLDSLSGRPFKEGVKVNDDVPEAVAELFEDINLRGDKLQTFLRQWFRWALAKAHCHVLVDYPRAAPTADGRPRTLADDRAEKLRPYWVLVPAENMLFMETEVLQGVETVTHARILEQEVVRDGWGERVATRVRVLEPGSVELWELRKTATSKEEWVRVDSYQTTLHYVPLVTYYTNTCGPQEGKPPLLDLAHLNVAHWQSSSDQRNVLTVARFPLLAASGALPEGADGTTKLEVGPNKWLHMSDPSGKFYYVEHTGAAIEAGAKDMADLEQAMSSYGAQFLQKQPGNPTATARALDSAETMSPLQAMTYDFESAVAQALRITADWMGQEQGGTVTLCKDFAPDDPSGAGLQTLDKARDRKDISRVAYLDELKERGILSEDYDAEDDLTALEDEATTLPGLTGATDEDLDPASAPAPAPTEE